MSTLSGPAAPQILPRLILPFLLLVLMVAGCAPLVRSDQLSQTGQALLEPGETIGQTFMARYAGLSGIEVYLEPGSAGTGELLLRLQDGIQEGGELARSQLKLSAISIPGFYRFPFQQQPGSTRQDYFITLELQGNGSVQAGVTQGKAYLNGALYRGQSPEDAQLAFRLVYDPWQAAFGLFVESLSWLGRLAAAGLLFVIPGWALLDGLSPGWKKQTWGEKLGLAIGASLAIYPLLFLWTHLLRLQLGPIYAWGPVLVGLVWLASPTIQNGLPRGADVKRYFRRLPVRLKRIAPTDLALLTLIALIFASRFWPIRSLEIPMWGDSYTHTLITQLLVEHRGLFSSWAPYAELQTFTYHFGFHTLSAVFYWITRLPVPQAVLWTGQILNGLAVLALYPLAVRFGRNRWAGVAAVLVAGLLAQMPMFYINWGRYTELAGLAILPTVIYLADRLVSKNPGEVEPITGDRLVRPKEERAPENPASRQSRNRKRWQLFARSDSFKTLLLVWIVLGGLALTHYRALVFAVLYLPAAVLFQLQPGRARLAILETLVIGIGAGLLFLPWFIRLFSGRILRVFGGLVTTPITQVAESIAQYNAIGDLESYLPIGIWIALSLALVWGIWRRERGVAILGFWCLLILLAANPHWLGLPGQGALSNFAVFIAAYLPGGILIGAAAGWALDEILGYPRRFIPTRSDGRGSGRRENPGNPGNPREKQPQSRKITLSKYRSIDPSRWRFVTAWIAFSLCLALGLWGARERVRDVAIAQYALVTRPDLRAMDWIRVNTPKSSRFLVNSFLAYGDTLVAGSDAGWWLPLLAGRETTLPPINYSSEQGPRPDYLDWTNALTLAIQEQGLEDPQVRAMLQERGVTHVYIGQRDGRVGNTGPALLQSATLSASPYFRVVYNQDRVWIFERLE